MSEAKPGFSGDISRRQFLEGTAALAAAAVLAGCGGGEGAGVSAPTSIDTVLPAGGGAPISPDTTTPATVQPKHVGTTLFYAEGWNSAVENDRIAEVINGRNIDALASFSLIDETGSAGVPAINDPASFSRLAAASGAFGISIGGALGNAENGWAQALANPEAFAESVYGAVSRFEELIGRKVGIVDLDQEPSPGAADADAYSRLAGAVRTRLPDVRMSAAVQPSEMAGFLAALRDGTLDEVNMMTYDFAGPWDDRSGFAGNGKEALSYVREWVNAGFAPSQLRVGFPLHWWAFRGADGPDQDYTNKDNYDENYSYFDSEAALGVGTMQDDSVDLTSGFKGDGFWASGQSIKVAHETMEAVRSEFPDIGGAFLWSDGGLTRDALSAVG